MTKRLKRPRDPAQLAKLIMDIAIGDIEDVQKDGKNPVAVERGKKGGAIGGKARAAKLSPEKRKYIAKKAIKSRWKASVHNS